MHLSGERISLSARAGTALAADTGFYQRNIENRMADEHFYLADEGSALHLLDKRYRYNLATYSREFPARLLHTYDYAPEQSWTTYAHDFRESGYRSEDYIFGKRCYFRICLKRVDGEAVTEEEAKHINDILEFLSTARPRLAKIFREEIAKVAARVNSLAEPSDLKLAILTDTHATVNGIWQDTISNLKAVHEQVKLSAIIHLGDMTDGLVSRELTQENIRNMQREMGSLGIPVHIALGNHDSNYFRKNPDIMPLHEQAQLYLQREKPYYAIELPAHDLRMVFLSAYDNETVPRYGYDLAQIEWLRRLLNENQQRTLVLSHDAPMAELDPWSQEIRNGRLLMCVLDQCKSEVLAYIHGHAHADYIHQWQGKQSFPIISIGCAKCEDMKEHKVEGSETPERVLGTSTQELWDVLIIRKNSQKLNFVRFGAGHDKEL